MTYHPRVRTASVLSLVFLAGCGSCGRSTTEPPEEVTAEDASLRFMAAGGPDGGKKFRIRGPMVPAVFDAGTP